MIHQTNPYSASLIGTIVGCLCLVLSSVATAAKPPPAYAGAWVLNQDETELLRDDLDEKTIKIPTAGRMQVSVMGIPLPWRRWQSGQRPFSTDCQTTGSTCAVSKCRSRWLDKTIQLTYPDLDPLEQKETLRAGHYRGRDSKWNRKKIQQKYKTSERKVSKTWTMRKDGRLLVEVSIKHKKAKKQTFSRVFDRLPTD
jgi:hypothetical protein